MQKSGTTKGPDLEEGYLKIAVYAVDDSFHHVAKQMPSGSWSSKIGQAHDLRHEELSALDDSFFFDHASACVFLRREYAGDEDWTLEERGLILTGDLGQQEGQQEPPRPTE